MSLVGMSLKRSVCIEVMILSMSKLSDDAMLTSRGFFATRSLAKLGPEIIHFLTFLDSSRSITS